MILLIGDVGERQSPAVEVVERLPEPPALMWTGFLVLCRDHQETIDLLAWAINLRGSRPTVPVGAVIPAREAEDLARVLEGIGIDPVATTNETAAAPRLITELVDRSIPAVITREWIAPYAPPPQNEALLRIIAEVGAGGGKIARLCRRLQRSHAQLYRDLHTSPLPSPGNLLREARVRAVELRCEGGAELPIALAGSGWLSEVAFRGVERRIREKKR